MPPWIWPSTSVGLIARPTSCAATTRRTFTVPSSMSTSTSATCAPNAYVSYGMPWPSASSGVVFGSYVPRPRSTQPRGAAGSSPSSTTETASAVPRRPRDRPRPRCVASSPASASVSSWRRRSSAGQARRVARHERLARGRRLARVGREVGVGPDPLDRGHAARPGRRRRSGRGSCSSPARCRSRPRTARPSRRRAGRPRSPTGWAATCCRCRTTSPRSRRRAGSCAVRAARCAPPRRRAARTSAAAERLEAGGQARARRAAAGTSRSASRPAARCGSRNSSGSMPSWPARSSISASWAIAACGTPKPRKAPGRRAVRVDRAARARDRGDRVRPIAWTGTRLATVGPHEA